MAFARPGLPEARRAEPGRPRRAARAPGPISGYQAAAERVWRRDGQVIRAIFRDTTIEAYEGCLAGDPLMSGPCGLTGQLLVRISPPGPAGADDARCPVPARIRCRG